MADTKKHRGKPPIALILAGYDKIDSEKRKKKEEEIRKAYDGDEIFIGQNKFLRDLAGKPVIQYVIDAVYGAEINGKRIYDEIYVYNDVQSFNRVIDASRYKGLKVVQMKKTVGGHWKDFYFNHVEYGQRVDIFFGDTPRITPEDVTYMHQEYNSILGKRKDHRGNTVHLIYGIVEYEDMKDDNWLHHRIRYIKRGKNAGKLKSFVGFDTFQARVGNTGAIIKHPTVDGMIENETANFFYNLRKALTPRTFSKILYHMWRTKQFNTIRQVKNRCIVENDINDTFFSVITFLHKTDFSKTGGILYHIKKNAAHWENDIDGPLDFEAFKQHFKEAEQKKKKAPRKKK